jgi:hypothetical protein
MSLISTTGGLLQTLKSRAFMDWSASILVKKMHSEYMRTDGSINYGTTFVNFGHEHGSYTFHISLTYFDSKCRIFVNLHDDVFAKELMEDGQPADFFKPIYFAKTVDINNDIFIEDEYKLLLEQVIEAFESRLNTIKAFIQNQEVATLQPVSSLSQDSTQSYIKYCEFLVAIAESCECNIVNMTFFDHASMSSVVYNNASTITVKGRVRAINPLIGGRSHQLRLLTRVQLLEIAKRNNIKGLSSMRKDEIFAILKSKLRKKK